jgi:hypothetical protein
MNRWYERPRIYYDWALYGQDISGDYAQHVVQKALDVHADTLSFCTVLGGYALWPSDVTPRYDRLGNVDLMGDLCRLSHEAGLYFVPWWLATASGGTACWLEQNPEWYLVGPPLEDGSQKRQNYICYNTPYRDIVYGEVREILARYPVDGIYFDQLRAVVTALFAVPILSANSAHRCLSYPTSFLFTIPLRVCLLRCVNSAMAACVLFVLACAPLSMK